ncbi:hypothetical protein ACEQUB_p01068 (plasmid) [Ralstonia syzygii]
MKCSCIRKPAGFTLVELLVVLAIVAVLLTIAVPRYFSSVDRAKETVLVENLRTTRDAIGKFLATPGVTRIPWTNLCSTDTCVLCPMIQWQTAPRPGCSQHQK